MIEDHIQRHSRIQTILNDVKERYDEMNKILSHQTTLNSAITSGSQEQQHQFLDEDITKLIRTVNGSDSSLDFEDDNAILEFQKRLARHNDKKKSVEDQ